MIRFRSLTGRLLVALLAPLMVAAVLIGLGGAWVTRNVVDYTSDRLLAGSVHAIAETVTIQNGRAAVDLPPWSLGLLDSPQRDSVFYDVRQSGRMLTGYADLPDFDAAAIAAEAGPVFRTVSYKGVSVRQAAEARRVPGMAAPVVISVAQTLESRAAVRKTLLTSVWLMEAGLLGLVALFLWPAAMWSLRPMEALRRDLSERSASRELDFTPAPTVGVPDELQPVVAAFNTLLAQLERSVEGVRRFTADASHQMRTPLAVVKTHLTLLNRPRRSAEDRESLADALGGVERLQRLIEQLLALARADAVDDHSHETGDLCACAKAVVARWRSRAAAADSTLDIAASCEAAPVALPGPLLEQILENLIDNAIRYGGPKIGVRVFTEAGMAILEVSDDGSGLPAALRDHPFERFTRGPGHADAGSGLGLSIVQALAERSGGRVSIEGGDGEAFRIGVHLPLAH